MTQRQEKLIENYVRMKVKKMFNETSVPPWPRELFYDLSDSVQALRGKMDSKDHDFRIIINKLMNNVNDLQNHFDKKYNKKWD